MNKMYPFVQSVLALATFATTVFTLDPENAHVNNAVISSRTNDNFLHKSPEAHKLMENDRMFNLQISLSKPVAKVDQRFLSLAVSSHIVGDWKRFNTSSPTLQTLCSALSPAYFRVGGTAADFLIYNQTNAFGSRPHLPMPPNIFYDYDTLYNTDNTAKKFYNFTMTASSWEHLNSFTHSMGWELLFDLNVLLRSGSQWDPSNSIHMLDHAIVKGYSQHLHLELGNEPDAFKHALNRTLDATQLGEDFVTLYDLIRHNPRYSPHFQDALLVGPDITHPRKSAMKYLLQYLQTVNHRIDKITVHHYYLNGRNSSQAEFLDPHTLSSLPEDIATLKQGLEDIGYSNATVWLGETSSCYGGGAPGLSDSYIAGFLWLDKLGQAAKLGVAAVFRQTLFGGHYALLNSKLQPQPDYWLTLLYKQLVGQTVLDVGVEDSPSRLRVYAHCTYTHRSKYLTEQYEPGAVTLLVLNLRNSSAELMFNKTSPPAASEKHVYWLTPHGDRGLTANLVNLNGRKLKMVDEHTLPVFRPSIVSAQHPVSIPSQSFGFIVLPEVQASACMGF